jgi:methionyl-tRNA formyltransferase
VVSSINKNGDLEIGNIMKYAFAGYDFFMDIIPVLDGMGWELSHATITDMTGQEPYNSHSKILAYCEENNVPFSFDKIDEETFVHLRELEINLLISAAYGHRIPISTSIDLKVLNLHPTLLPQGKGPWPLPHIILRQDNKSGISLHKVSAEWDSGEIVAQHAFDVAPDETLESLTFKSRLAAQELMKEVARDFDQLWKSARPQANDGTYWKGFIWEKDRVIDWNWPVEKIDRLIRAFGNFDCGAVFDGQEWIVQSARCWQAQHDAHPGTVILKGTREVLVAASDGYVLITHYRPDPS